MIRSYSQLILIPTFEERLDYLKLNGRVSDLVFGGHRYLNQKFYQSKEWKKIRRSVILRDNGCDLAYPGHPIYDKVLIHHIEPVSIDDLINRSPQVFDLDNLVCVSFDTHQAIHYNREAKTRPLFVERTRNDTAPWKD